MLLCCHDALLTRLPKPGLTQLPWNDIRMKTNEPVYTKQPRILDAHQETIDHKITMWLRLGLIQPAQSKRVHLPDQGLPKPQHQHSNWQYAPARLSWMPQRNWPFRLHLPFWTLNLTKNVWQQQLHSKAQDSTTFTIPREGQFLWKMTPRGLIGAPASFQWLMETTMDWLPHAKAYIDNLMLHSETHPDHLQYLKQATVTDPAGNLGQPPPVPLWDNQHRVHGVPTHQGCIRDDISIKSLNVKHNINNICNWINKHQAGNLIKK